MNRAILMASTASVAFLVGYAAYVVLLVPRLGDMISVPYWMWFALGAPFAGTCCVWGWRADDQRELVVAVAACALPVLLCLYALAVVGAPGLSKSYAIDEPARFWSQGLAATVAVSLVCCSIGGIVRRLAR